MGLLPIAGRASGVDRYVDLHDAQEFAVAIEDLNPAIAAIRHVDVALRIGGDIVRRVELAGLVAAVAPGFDPVAVLVGLGDARIDVAVADENIALRIEGDIGRLPEAAVLGGLRRDWMFQRSGFFVGGFLLAAEHHGHAARWIELDDHVRAFVDHPDIVVLVDAHRMRERPGIKILADLTDELAVGSELEQLRGGCGVGRARWCCRARRRRRGPWN